VASRFSQHVATLSIAHGLAECARATLPRLRKKVREAPADDGPRSDHATLSAVSSAERGFQQSEPGHAHQLSQLQ
jgi:hypothetical protein